MSETKETDNKSGIGRKTMSLNVKRTVEQGHIRQNFSHGRSKSVLVETKRKRVTAPGLTEEPQQQQKAEACSGEAAAARFPEAVSGSGPR